MRPKGERRTAIIVRRTEVARLSARGFRQEEIAEQLGLPHGMVRKDCMAIRQAHVEAFHGTVDEWASRVIADLEEMYRELWAAWEKSKTARKVTTSGTDSGPNGDRHKAFVTEEDQCGDPRYMAILESIEDKLIRLKGLYAKEPAAPAPIVNITLGHVPTDRLEQAEREWAALVESQVAEPVNGQLLLPSPNGKDHGDGI